MEHKKKIKLVIIMHSELAQRWLDYFCLDTLNEHFDLEYWDCSDFVLPGFHFDNKVERDYVKKIHSNWDLWRNLRHLPKDALISNDVHFNRSNYIYHQLLSHYFPKINYINFYANVPNKKLKENIIEENKLSLYQNFKRWIKAVRHYIAVRVKKLLNLYYTSYEIHEISCALDAKYHINHPDVEVYLKYKGDTEKDVQSRYMVYIDQFFPFHPDIAEHYPGLDVDIIASGFYNSINKFFDSVEKKYQCEIIIAAHPLSNFKENPFGGRKMIINRTGELISKCDGVLMHSSNALAYAMLFRRPILLLVNSQTKIIDYFNNPILNTSAKYGIPMIDMDTEEDVDIHFLKKETYQLYIQTYFGNIDKENMIPNSELLPKYLKQVWNDMYGKNIMKL